MKPYLREVTRVEIIPEELRKWREHYGISITEAAAKVQSYAWMEFQTYKPNEDQLRQLEEMFDDAERRKK